MDEQPPAVAPVREALDHENVFDNEADFLAHYSIARDLARNPLNHVRVCDGEDLLGIPVLDPRGQVHTVMGRVQWRSRPRPGWITVDGDASSWRRVPFLAPYLQSTSINEHASMRITPEVRVERVGAQALLIRTLSIELKIYAAIEVDDDMLERVKASVKPYVKAWFPLHPDISLEMTSAPPQEEGTHEYELNGVAMAEKIIATSMLLRFRASHTDVDNAAPLG